MWIKNRHIDFSAISGGISLCLLSAASPAMANPQGGQVVAGQATIRYGSTTVITQTSNRAVVNWKDFSINANETTTFKQPGRTSVILNRVTGNNISQIMGNLTANGQVFLVNRNGIVFGKTARVDVAGLIASTADIRNSDFMQGNYHFMNAPADSKIINEGNITVRGAGLAALVAPNVENRGVITATLGRVALASGSAFTVDLYGDNLITFDASSTVKGAVNNMGTIMANGGTVMLSVAAAEGIVENVINTSGYISAQSVSNKNGKIVLKGYDNSTITVAGTLDATGLASGETGGTILVLGEHVQLANGSLLNASGDVAGGFIETSGKTFTMQGATVLAGSAHGLAGKWLIDPIDLIVTDVEAIIYNTALQAGTNVSINADNNITFINAITPITWANTAVFDVISDFDHDGAGTITFTLGTVSTSAGTINFFYNPAVYPAPTDFSTNVSVSGTGVFNPYMLVNSPTQLQQISSNTSGAYALNKTLDMTAFSYLPITTFSGKLYGNGFSIDNLTISSSSASVGLFLNMTGGFLKDIIFNNPNITSTFASSTVGSLVASMTGGTLLGSFTTNGGTVSGVSNVGGLIGAMTGGTFAPTSGASITNVGTAVSGTGSNIGGLFGRVAGGTFTPLSTTFSNSGTVRISAGAGSNVGGLFGTFTLAGTTFDGLSLLSNTGTIGNSTGSINADQTGGLFGNIAGAASPGAAITLHSPTTNSGNVYGKTSTGGLIGSASNLIISDAVGLSNSLTTTGSAIIRGTTQVGGLIGLYGTVVAGEQSTFTATGTVSTAAGVSVSGVHSIGGLMGVLSIGSAFTPSTGTGTVTLTNNATVNADVSGIVSGIVGTGGLFGTLSVRSMGYNLTNTGAVTTSISQSQSTGGIAGRAIGAGSNATVIVNSTLTNENTGIVSAVGSTNVGGIFGEVASVNFTGLLNSYASVSGFSNVGGIAGASNFTTFSAGSVTYGDGINAVTLTLAPNGSILGGIIGITGNNSNGSGLSQCGGTSTCTLSNPKVNLDVTYVADASTNGIGGLVGLFANVLDTLNLNGTFTNLSNINVQGSAVGGFIGLLVVDKSTIQSVLSGTFVNTVNVSGGGSVGGIIGEAVLTGTTLDATLANDGEITSTGDFAGGLIGASSGGAITGAHAFESLGRSKVTGTNYVGGLIGQIEGGTFSVTGSVFSTGSVSGSGNYIGGLMGYSGSTFSGSGTLTNNATVEATGTGTQSIGGIFGYYNSNNNSYNMTNASTGVISLNPGTLANVTHVGGIIGEFEGGTFTGALTNNAIILAANNTAANVGGIVGLLDGGIISSTTLTNTGNVFGGLQVAGIIGQIASGTFSPAGAVSVTGATIAGASNVGGIVGLMSGGTFAPTSGITLSTDATAVSGTGSYIGGLFGRVSAGTFTPLSTTLSNAGTVKMTGGAPGINLGGVFGSFEIGGTTFDAASILENTGVIGDSVDSSNNAISNTGGIFGYLNPTLSSSIIIISALRNSASVYGGVGSVSDGSNTGGLIGFTDRVTLSGAADFTTKGGGSAITIMGAGDNIGGLIGKTGNVNSNLFVFNRTGDTSTDSNVTVQSSLTNTSTVVSNIGGLFGSMDHILTLSPSSGTVTLINNAAVRAGASDLQFGTNIGGIIGFLVGTSLSSSYNMTNNGIITANGDLNFGSNIGGIFGRTILGIYSGTYTNNGAILAHNASNVGGIMGYVSGDGTINSSFNASSTLANYANVSGGNTVGGIVGRLGSSRLNGSVLLGNGAPITLSLAASGTNLGGIAGFAGFDFTSSSTIRMNNITIASGVTYSADETTTSIGGIIGFLNANTFTLAGTVSSASNVIVQGSNVGGYIGTWDGPPAGTNAPVITATFANTRNVTGGSSVGGIIGKIGANSSSLALNITSSMSNSGTITGIANTVAAGDNVGGLIGQISGANIHAVTLSGTNAFQTLAGSAVIGVNNVGGLVGSMYNTTFNRNGANNILSTGTVAGSGGAVGGLFGYIDTTVAAFSPSSGTINMVNNATVTETAGTGAFGGVGGVIGYFNANITSAYNMTNNAAVTGTNSLNGTVESIGGIVGVINNGTFSGSLAGLGNVSGPANVGGIAGKMQSSILSGILSYGDTSLSTTYTLTLSSGGTNLGAIAGNIAGTVASDNINLANVTVHDNTVFNVTGASNIGGIVGLAETGTTLSGTFTANTNTNTLTINGATNVGAIIGKALSVALSSITNATILSGTSDIVAGIVGYATQTTFDGNFSNTANITGSGHIAGLFGVTDNSSFDGTFTNTGNVDPPLIDYAGGIDSHSTNDTFVLGATFTNSGDVTGLQYVGGLFGAIDGISTTFANNVTMTNSGGTITGTNYVGGAIGQVDDGVQVNAVYAISNTTLVASGSGLGGFVGHLTGGSDLGGSGSIASNVVFSPLAGASDIGTVVGVLDNDSSLSGVANFTLPASLTIANAVSHVGGYIGKMLNVSNFNNTISSTINVTASSSDYVAGVIGWVEDSTINSGSSSLSYASDLISATVTGNDYVAGIIANMVNSDVSQVYLCCHIYPTTAQGGSVVGNDHVGGLVASIDASSTLSNSYNNSLNNSQGVFAGTSATYVGGIAAVNAGTIQNTIFGGVIHFAGAGTFAGGLVGLNTGSILSSLSGGHFDTAILPSTNHMGGIAGQNNGTIPTALNAPFYSTTKFGAGINAVGSGTTGGASGTDSTLIYASTFGSPYNWNFSSVYEEQSSPVSNPPSFYVTLQRFGLDSAIPSTAAPIPPTPPTPPTPTPTPPNFVRQYVTVEQTLVDTDLTGLDWSVYTILDTFGLYKVPMKNYTLPFIVAIFYSDPSKPDPTAALAEHALIRKGWYDPSISRYAYIVPTFK